MQRWILASQTEKQGRLYWSTQRGWTYKELASLYREPTRETMQARSLLCAEPIWLEVKFDARGFIKVIEPEERPFFGSGKDVLNQIGDLTADVVFVPHLQRRQGRRPDMIHVHRGYNVNIYRKATA